MPGTTLAIYATPVLLVIVAMLIGLLLRKQGTAHLKATIDVSPQMAAELEAVIHRIGAAAAHHADVSAVVELVRQLDANPDALELIKSYPETVRAAAWLHYVNSLGASLQVAQNCLRKAHDGSYDRSYLYGHNAAVDDWQKRVDALRVKLDAAIAASGQGLGLRAV